MTVDLDALDWSDRPSEADFCDRVGTEAQWHGWLVAHFRPGWTAKGPRTPVQFDGAGFPDLVLVHPGRRRVLFRELKSMSGRLTTDQRRWLRSLHDAGADADVWRPSEQFAISALLANERGAA